MRLQFFFSFLAMISVALLSSCAHRTIAKVDAVQINSKVIDAPYFYSGFGDYSQAKSGDHYYTLYPEGDSICLFDAATAEKKLLVMAASPLSVSPMITAIVDEKNCLIQYFDNIHWAINGKLKLITPKLQPNVVMTNRSNPAIFPKQGVCVFDTYDTLQCKRDCLNYPSGYRRFVLMDTTGATHYLPYAMSKYYKGGKGSDNAVLSASGDWLIVSTCYDEEIYLYNVVTDEERRIKMTDNFESKMIKKSPEDAVCSALPEWFIFNENYAPRFYGAFYDPSDDAYYRIYSAPYHADVIDVKRFNDRVKPLELLRYSPRDGYSKMMLPSGRYGLLNHFYFSDGKLYSDYDSKAISKDAQKHVMVVDEIVPVK